MYSVPFIFWKVYLICYALYMFGWIGFNLKVQWVNVKSYIYIYSNSSLYFSEGPLQWLDLVKSQLDKLM